jgi:alpha-tubulin suppressor-like RCC1 family protein
VPIFGICCGDNNVGQLGLGDTNPRGDAPNEMPPPNAIVGGNVVDVYTSSFVCALLDTGNVRCWGYNLFGQLGYGHTNNLGNEPGELPTPDLDLGGEVDFLANGTSFDHLCAVLIDGTVRCWGWGVAGRLGYENTNSIGDQGGEMPPAPVQVY